MTVVEHLPIHISDHAMWQAAERFPGFDTVLIEEEVRSALAAGRIDRRRGQLGLHNRDDPTSLYVWVELPRGCTRVYALRVDRGRNDGSWIVTTTMKGRRAQ